MGRLGNRYIIKRYGVKIYEKYRKKIYRTLKKKWEKFKTLWQKKTKEYVNGFMDWMRSIDPVCI